MNLRLIQRPLISSADCPRSRFYLTSQLFAFQRTRLGISTKIRFVRYSSEELASSRRTNTTKYPDPASLRHVPKRRPGIAYNLDAIRTAIKQNPITGGFAIFCICFAVAALIIVSIAEIYVNFFLQHNFPDSVARPARKALYFSSLKFDPPRAIKFYKEAIFAAQEAQLHFVSDEVIGLKVHLAGFFEDKCMDLKSAAMVYEHVYKECVKFLQSEGDQHFADGHRSRVLERSIRTAVKLGQIYGTPQIKRFDDAEEMLTLATETILREQKRRKEKGVQQGEGSFLSNEEVGASLEALATSYMSRNRFDYATPLYLHAMSLCPPKSCHIVILMNNLASSIAQQEPLSNPPPNFPTLTQQAELWARKALSTADAIPAADRTEECSSGRATATANLAEFAERAGRLQEALQLFKDAQKLSKAIAFDEGSQVASSGALRVRNAMQAKG